MKYKFWYYLLLSEVKKITLSGWLVIILVAAIIYYIAVHGSGTCESCALRFRK